MTAVTKHHGLGDLNDRCVFKMTVEIKTLRSRSQKMWLGKGLHIYRQKLAESILSWQSVCFEWGNREVVMGLRMESLVSSHKDSNPVIMGTLPS